MSPKERVKRGMGKGSQKVSEESSRLVDFLSFLISDEGYKTALKLVELASVFSICALIILGLIFLGIGPEPEDTRTGKIIILLNNNWKVALLLLVPLLYLPIRTFVEELEELGIGRLSARRRNPVGPPQTHTPRRGEE